MGTAAAIFLFFVSFLLYECCDASLTCFTCLNFWFLGWGLCVCQGVRKGLVRQTLAVRVCHCVQAECENGLCWNSLSEETIKG